MIGFPLVEILVLILLVNVALKLKIKYFIKQYTDQS